MLHMLHAECLTVDPDHSNRNTEALPQAHRKKPLPHGHPKPSRPAETTWLRFQASAPAIWTREACATCRKPCFCALRTSRYLSSRVQGQGLWGLPNISAFLQATCATLPVISAAGTCRSIPACVGSASIRAEACQIRHGKPSSRSSVKSSATASVDSAFSGACPTRLQRMRNMRPAKTGLRLRHDTPCGMPGNRVAQVRKLGSPLRPGAHRSSQWPPKLERHTVCVKTF